MQNELIRVEIMVRLDEELDENDKVLIKNIVVDIFQKHLNLKENMYRNATKLKSWFRNWKQRQWLYFLLSKLKTMFGYY